MTTPEARAVQTQVITGCIAFILYPLIAWGISRLDLGLSFWQALGVLLGLRLLFGIVEMIGGVLAWRLYGRRAAVDGFLGILRENEFPQRAYRHDDFSNYLARIEDDLADVKVSRPVTLRRIAGEFRLLLQLAGQRGMLAGMRMHAACDAALEAYSPRANAPAYGAEPTA